MSAVSGDPDKAVIVDDVAREVYVPTACTAAPAAPAEDVWSVVVSPACGPWVVISGERGLVLMAGNEDKGVVT
eukprot:m.104104 g.104104  ORF g.104104 m.104104 type:complete len:73 (-) comp10509_c0_seq3:205-423(-)